MQDHLPAYVFQAIQQHLRTASLAGEKGWHAGKDEEDTLTGHYLSKLQTDEWQVVSIEGVEWRWKFNYKKFASKGTDAPEKHLGADGIIQIELQDMRQRTSRYKGLLFQAKKLGGYSKSTLVEQVEKMEGIAPGISAVFEYGPHQFLGIPSRHYIGDQKLLAENDGPSRLGDFLADQFLPCRVGLRGLYYIAKSLIVPDKTEGVIRVRGLLGHRLNILVRQRKRW